MVLGTHPPLVGADAETGVVFVDTAVTPIRHLGVLLSVSGGTAFAEQLFEQRLGSITHRARLWSRYDLSLLGRCEVARQVLASCLVYHAQFVPVPERIMAPAAAPHQSLHAGHGVHAQQRQQALGVQARRSSGVACR